MSKKQEFISFVSSLLEKHPEEKMNENAAAYWDGLRTTEEKEKPVITDNGKVILKYLQEDVEHNAWTSRRIAEGIGMSSRSVSGSMMKLANEGFIEKRGQDPISYAITEKGVNFMID